MDFSLILWVTASSSDLTGKVNLQARRLRAKTGKTTKTRDDLMNIAILPL